MRMTILFASFLLATQSFAQQNQCANLAGVYEYQSMSSQCSLKRAVAPDRYYEGQDAAINWPCELSWVDAPSSGDAFIIKNHSRIVVEQNGCDSVKLIFESVSGKKFACEFAAKASTCIGSDYTVSSNLNFQACTREVPRNVRDYNGILISKNDAGLALTTLQLKRVAISPWMGTQREKLIQCGFSTLVYNRPDSE